MKSFSIKDSQFDFGDISRYRTQLMGMASLMIIACHAPASGVLMPPVLANVLSYGNFGVDIFLLLSGLGLYYSLSKRPVENGGGILPTVKGGLVDYSNHILLFSCHIVLFYWLLAFIRYQMCCFL